MGRLVNDAVQHRFWRLRHNVGTNQVFFETSADGIAWAVRRTVTRQIAITASQFELCAGTFNWNDVADTARFDNFVLTTTPGALLSDNIFDNSRDVAKWNFGVVNRPARAFDPQVQVQEQNQRLEITPRALMGGLPIGNLSLYQTSSDGIAWVTQRTVAVGVPLTALKIELSAGTYNFVSPTGTAIFDNFVSFPQPVACKIVTLRRSVYRYRPRPKRDGEIIKLLLELAHERPEQGVGKLFERLRRPGAL